ncbi:TonB-dependent receptor [Wenyingzhuangia sp. chi5]|uniref:TonB-dependent receptor n=1 Tax=Wenyingzhuangia gilva TaxID=3057677 RepID=A0ABT8VTA4_9FLAO|nr:TonB-dependent receptor [Wenyingzhuangia sp. chi5]MDO3695204.1 TonB-dependent receptor [Wenyingzhuangia sp. chi5]
MKKISIFLFLFASIFANAQKFTLSGSVTNQNNEALLGATVLVLDTTKGGLTDINGEFSVQLSNGDYTLQVSYLGYNTVSKDIKLSKNTFVSFKLEPNSTVLEEVLVSAVRANSDVPVTFSNISKKELEKRNLGQDIPILLKYTPSVVSSSDAGAGVGYTYMNIRGSDATRINVTVNGIPYNDAESQGSFWVNLGDFASSTQNLQIQRGVGTSTNGSGAFGASINILTDAVSEEASGEISNSFGSYNTRKHTVKFSTGKLNDHIEIAGRLSNIYSDGYVDRAYTDLKSFYLQASYTDENTLIKAITFGGKEKTYQAWYGLTAEELKEDRRQNPYTYDNEVDDYTQTHYQLHWNEKLNQNWSTNLGLNYTKGAGFFEQYKADKDAQEFNNLIIDGSDLIVRRWLDNDFYVANFSTNYKVEGVDFITGISYSNYTGDHFGEVIWGSDLAANTNIRDRYYFSDAKKSDFSVFAKTTLSLTEKLSSYIDLQGRFVGYKTKGITSDIIPIDVNKNYKFFNPKVGLTYKMNANNSLYVSYARANREPNRNDFESNNNVKHEKLNDYELGWRLNDDKIKLNSNIYFMQYKDQLILTGGLDGTGNYKRKNVDNSYRLGIEIDADIELTPQIYLRPNIALSTNKIKNFILDRDNIITNIGTTNIAFSPNVVAGNAFVYQPIASFQISLLSKYVGEQYLSNTDTKASKLEDYFTSDLNLVYELKTKSIFESVLFTGLINNVFDKEYVDRGYTYLDNWSGPTSFEVQGYYPQATRNFLVGVTLKF